MEPSLGKISCSPLEPEIDNKAVLLYMYVVLNRCFMEAESQRTGWLLANISDKQRITNMPPLKFNHLTLAEMYHVCNVSKQ